MKEIIGFGLLPCLHCGKIIKMDGDIHVCDAPKNAWLDMQDEAYIEVPNVGVWDLKTKQVVKRFVSEDKENQNE